MLVCNWVNSPNWMRYTAEVPLNQKTTHVWLIPMDMHRYLTPSLLNLLNTEEKERASRYLRDADKARFELGHIIVRLLLSRLLYIPPSNIDIVAGKYRKPKIASRLAPLLHFNISHSEKYIAIAISTEAVGIDIEHIQPNFQFQDLIQTAFSRSEEIYINQHQNREKAFYLLWTRKESLLKAAGTGLSERLNTIPVLEGSHEIDLDNFGLKGNYNTTSFLYQSDYMISLSYQTAFSELRFWQYY